MDNERVELSVVVPFYNEEENIEPMYSGLKDTLDGLGRTYELLFVNDGSTDKTDEKLSKFYSSDQRVKIVKLRRNFGQTSALAAGFDLAKGEIIISMDGDLQHDPGEIPKFLEKIDAGFDVVSGWRKERVDSFLTRRLPSMIANRLIKWFSGVNIHDFGTTFKAYRRETIKNLELSGDMHRYIPVLAARTGASIVEIPISNKLRQYGSSKYGLSRTARVVPDLISVKYLTAFATNPLRILGLLGLGIFSVGFAISLMLVLAFLIGRIDAIRDHIALLLLSVLLMVIGIQFVTSGITAEVNARIYSRVMNRKSYAIKEVKDHKI